MGGFAQELHEFLGIGNYNEEVKREQVGRRARPGARQAGRFAWEIGSGDSPRSRRFAEDPGGGRGDSPPPVNALVPGGGRGGGASLGRGRSVRSRSSAPG